jgi:hypothetical protein
MADKKQFSNTKSIVKVETGIVKSDNLEFVRYCGSHFQYGDHYKFFNVRNQFGTSLSTHISNFDDIGQCWIFTAHFLYCILAVILKMADISKFWKCRIAPLMVTYHYVKLYVSIIIYLEVININVRNFNFPRSFTIFLGWRYFLECRRYQTILARGLGVAPGL